MTRFVPVPRGPRHSRPLLVTTAAAALLLLSACGGGSDDAASPAESASSSVSASGTPSASASASATGSAEASESPQATETSDPDRSAQATEPAEHKGAEPGSSDASAPGQRPEAERTASAPELGMPTATPFTPSAEEKAKAQAACSVDQLRGGLGPRQGAAGSIITSVTLTNTGSQPCTLQGYPGVSFVNSAGEIIGAPASRDGAGAPAAVTIAPGQSASAGIKIVQPGVIGQVCNPHDATGIRVYPPGSHDAITIGYDGQACGNPKVAQLQVKGFGG